jgi:bifunctional DNA-binding transcriptional regulator/antitoxin component of YhaV-PrlF toxin-antitoxin module
MPEIMRRRLDKLGRLVIPVEFRRLHDLDQDAKVALIVDTEAQLTIDPHVPDDRFEQTATLDDLGRVVIWSQMRQYHNLGPGCLVELEMMAESIALRPVRNE